MMKVELLFLMNEKIPQATVQVFSLDLVNWGAVYSTVFSFHIISVPNSLILCALTRLHDNPALRMFDVAVENISINRRHLFSMNLTLK